ASWKPSSSLAAGPETRVWPLDDKVTGEPRMPICPPGQVRVPSLPNSRMRRPADFARVPSRSSGGGRLLAAVSFLSIVVIALGAPAAVDAGKKPPPPDLPAQHRHPSGGMAFRTPESWTVDSSTATPETVNASGDGVAVRFVYHDGESGYDSLHGICMLERLAP